MSISSRQYFSSARTASVQRMARSGPVTSAARTPPWRCSRTGDRGDHYEKAVTPATPPAITHMSERFLQSWVQRGLCGATGATWTRYRTWGVPARFWGAGTRSATWSGWASAAPRPPCPRPGRRHHRRGEDLPAGVGGRSRRRRQPRAGAAGGMQHPGPGGGARLRGRRRRAAVRRHGTSSTGRAWPTGCATGVLSAPAAARPVGAALADALAYVHRARDRAPRRQAGPTCCSTARGRPQLTDFGIARAHRRHTGVTAARAVSSAPPPFMAPAAGTRRGSSDRPPTSTRWGSCCWRRPPGAASSRVPPHGVGDRPAASQPR